MDELDIERGDALETRVVVDFDTAARLWTDLMAGATAATFFASHAWHSVWWRHHSAGRQLLVLVVLRAGHPVGIGPFMVERRSGTSVVRFCASGASDYGDILADERETPRQRVVWAILDGIRAHCPGAVLDLEQVPDRGGSIAPVLAWAAARGYRVRCQPQEECPYQVLPAGEVGFDASLPPSARQQERRNTRALGRQGPLRIEPRGLETAGIPGLVREMAEIERCHPAAGERVNHWTGRHGDFLTDLLTAVAGTGDLWLGGVWVADGLAAYSVAFQRGDVLYGYLKGYRQEYARQGPGSLLHLQVQRAAIRHGIRTIDYLRGAEPYKRAWQTNVGQNFRIFLRPPATAPLARSAGLAYVAGESWRGTLQGVAGRLRPARRAPGGRGGDPGQTDQRHAGLSPRSPTTRQGQGSQPAALPLPYVRGPARGARRGPTGKPPPTPR